MLLKYTEETSNIVNLDTMASAWCILLVLKYRKQSDPHQSMIPWHCTLNLERIYSELILILTCIINAIHSNTYAISGHNFSWDFTFVKPPRGGERTCRHRQGMIPIQKFVCRRPELGFIAQPELLLTG
jgi:hypothetical protein